MMKRRSIMAAFVLLLMMLLTVTAHAWTEYGVIYDDTELLFSEELERLGTQVLPELTEKYGIDMRVDILTSVSGYDDDLELAAAGIYEDYGYGYGDGRNGVTLTLVVSVDDGDVSLEGFLPYAGGDSWELTTHGSWNICRNSDIWLTKEAWSGDLAQDIEMLEGAINDMAEGLEKFVLAGGVHSTIWDAQTQSLITQEPEPAQTQTATTAQTQPAQTQAATTAQTQPAQTQAATTAQTQPAQTQTTTTAQTQAPIQQPVSGDESGRTGAILWRVAVIILLPLAVAGVAVGIMESRMRSVATATQAAAYQKEKLELTLKEDLYTHTTKTEEQIKQK